MSGMGSQHGSIGVTGGRQTGRTGHGGAEQGAQMPAHTGGVSAKQRIKNSMGACARDITPSPKKEVSL